MELILHHPEFVTATIHNWLPLLQPEKHKKIIEDSLISSVVGASHPALVGV